MMYCPPIEGGMLITHIKIYGFGNLTINYSVSIDLNNENKNIIKTAYLESA